MPEYKITRVHYVETEGSDNPEVQVEATATIEADTWPEALAQFEYDAPTIVRLPERTSQAEEVRGFLRNALSGGLAKRSRIDAKVNF